MTFIVQNVFHCCQPKKSIGKIPEHFLLYLLYLLQAASLYKTRITSNYNNITNNSRLKSFHDLFRNIVTSDENYINYETLNHDHHAHTLCSCMPKLFYNCFMIVSFIYFYSIFKLI